MSVSCFLLPGEMETKRNWHWIIQTHVVLYIHCEKDNAFNLDANHCMQMHTQGRPCSVKASRGNSGAKYPGPQLQWAPKRPAIKSLSLESSVNYCCWQNKWYDKLSKFFFSSHNRSGQKWSPCVVTVVAVMAEEFQTSSLRKNKCNIGV